LHFEIAGYENVINRTSNSLYTYGQEYKQAFVQPLLKLSQPMKDEQCRIKSRPRTGLCTSQTTTVYLARKKCHGIYVQTDSHSSSASTEKMRHDTLGH